MAAAGRPLLGVDVQQQIGGFVGQPGQDGLALCRGGGAVQRPVTVGGQGGAQRLGPAPMAGHVQAQLGGAPTQAAVGGLLLPRRQGPGGARHGGANGLGIVGQVSGHQHAAQVLEGGGQMGGVGVTPVPAELARQLRSQQRAQEVFAHQPRGGPVGQAVQQRQARGHLVNGAEAQQPHRTVQAAVAAGAGTGKHGRVAEPDQARAQPRVLRHRLHQRLHAGAFAAGGALHLACGALQAGKVGLAVQVRHQPRQRGLGEFGQLGRGRRTGGFQRRSGFGSHVEGDRRSRRQMIFTILK